MAKSFANLVVETSSTTGTGTYSLAGIPAGSGYKTFRQAFSNGETKVCYVVRNADNTRWEINEFGTLTYGTPDTLSRNVIDSTNSGSAVTWVSGDLPLTVYIPRNAEIDEIVAAGALGSARPNLIRWGLWWHDDQPASGWSQGKFYDGTNTTVRGKLNKTTGKWIPDPAQINFPPGHIQGL